MGACSSSYSGSRGSAAGGAGGAVSTGSEGGRGAPRPFAPAVPRVKLVLLGDSGVGKSCIVHRYVRGTFDPANKVTVGAAFVAHSVPLPDGSTVKFEIWDTAGQERYMSLAPLYYRGASAAAVTYDITNKESFEKAQYWVKELQKNATGSIVIILVGNKTDLEPQREVQRADAQEYADGNGMMFIETSAKTAEQVPQLFENLAAKLASPGSSSGAAVLPASATAAR